MRLETRKVLDRAFTGSGALAIGLMAVALAVLLVPVFMRGLGAIFFTGTIEHRRLLLERFERGDRAAVEAEIRAAQAAREPVYRLIADYERELDSAPAATRRQKGKAMRELKKAVQALLGPTPNEPRSLLMRDQYGQTRWDRALVKLDRVLHREEWDYSNPTRGGVKVLKPRGDDFAGTSLAPLFPLLRDHARDMLLPRRTVYWGFLTDASFDSHMFGGIRAEILGTFYLTVGAMLFAIPMGIVSAIYLTEYAREGRLVSTLRTCISTLAGVPSIVFGLFGLAFFINTLGVSESRSVLAGSMTLALMVMPTVIRAAEEAILAVPRTYKEAALSLGAGRWHTVWSVILPAALPGILTGIVLAMGRAAGETAPIIFTAAVSVGPALRPWETLSQATPALPWNIYNLSTEHKAVDEIRHVQFGLVLVLVGLVLALNLIAILLRARVSRRLRA
jgi:phosphate transport system permease protein